MVSLSLYSTTLLDVTGEDSVLLWQREDILIIKCRGVPIIVAHLVLLKKILFLIEGFHLVNLHQ